MFFGVFVEKIMLGGEEEVNKGLKRRDLGIFDKIRRFR